MNEAMITTSSNTSSSIRFWPDDKAAPKTLWNNYWQRLYTDAQQTRLISTRPMRKFGW